MIDMNSPTYDPDLFCDTLIDLLHVKNDARLADALGSAPPTISKIRNRKCAISALMLLRVHELTGLPTREIRTWAEAA